MSTKKTRRPGPPRSPNVDRRDSGKFDWDHEHDGESEKACPQQPPPQPRRDDETQSFPPMAAIA